MTQCDQCRRSDVEDKWEFCPRCGAAVLRGVAGADVTNRQTEIKEVLTGLAATMAATFVKGRIQQQFGPLAQLLDHTFAPAAPVRSEAWPEWYAAAVNEQQPSMDQAELARRQAEEISSARMATEMARSAIEQSKSMSAILSRGRD